MTKPQIKETNDPDKVIYKGKVYSRSVLYNQLHNIKKYEKLAEGTCFDKQLAFMNDTSKRKALFCARRSGKSFTLGIYIIQLALTNPGTKYLYVGLSKAEVENIIWKDVIQKELLRRDINFKYNQNTKTLKFENGSELYFMGGDSSPQDMKRMLGGKYFMVVIDECQSIRQNIKEMVDEVLGPAMADFLNKGGGIICLAGTPGKVQGEHYWYQVTKTQDDSNRPHPDRLVGWSVHTWGMPDNPHMAKEFEIVCLEEEKKYGPAYVNEDSFRSQYLGQWVKSDQVLVYKFHPKRNLLDLDIKENVELMQQLLDGKNSNYYYVCGIDLGWEDPSAIVVGAYNLEDDTFYVVESQKHGHLVINALAGLLMTYQSKYDIVKMVIDTGGAGKLVAESIRDQYHLPIVGANKVEKENSIARLNSDLVTGKLKMIEYLNKDLIKELSTHRVDQKKLAQGIFKEHDSTHNHCFIAGTLVETEQGPKPIESIKTGDRVLTRAGYYPVKVALRGSPKPIWKLETESGNILYGTADHPILANFRFIEMKDLLNDDVLVGPEKQDRVKSVLDTGTSQEVYNLSVNDIHEYFANNILVHNCSDALLYAWKESLHWRAKKPPPKTDDFADEVLKQRERTKPIWAEKDILDTIEDRREVRRIVSMYRDGGFNNSKIKKDPRW